MRRVLIYVPAVFLILAATPPRAAAPAEEAVPAPTTAGCLLVSNLIAKHATQAKDRELAQLAFYFFAGRIDARSTPNQLADEFQQQGRLIKASNVSALMNACLREMQPKLQMIQSVGQHLRQSK